MVKTTEIYDFIWSEPDNAYMAFPRGKGQGIFLEAVPHTLLASNLAGCGAVQLPQLKKIIYQHLEDIEKNSKLL